MWFMTINDHVTRHNPSPFLQDDEEDVTWKWPDKINGRKKQMKIYKKINLIYINIEKKNRQININQLYSLQKLCLYCLIVGLRDVERAADSGHGSKDHDLEFQA